MTQHSRYAPEVQRSLEVARTLVQLGVPIFLLESTDDTGRFKTGYKPPKNWQNTTPDASVIDRWEPGMALAAVCGHTFDVIDVDPRNGGDISALDGALPTVYARAKTPSGGDHFWIKSLGLAKDQINEGIDYQGGAFTANSSGSHGRGFVFLPPTERNSKVDGNRYSYTWTQMPPAALTFEYSTDTSGHTLALSLEANSKKKSNIKREKFESEIDRCLTEGIPKGQQHYVMSRIAFDLVARGSGDHHIMLTLKAILTKCDQDPADPWTDDALLSLIYSARSKVDPGSVFQPWMLERTIDMIERSLEEYGLDPKLPGEIEKASRRRRADKEAKRRVDEEEAARNWRGWGEPVRLDGALDDDDIDLDYLFGQIISKDDNVLLAAKYKAGKTTMLGSFVKSILDGTSFLDKFEVNEEVADMTVGIWNCEMTKKGFLNYLRKSNITNGGRAVLHNLRGFAVPFFRNPVAREATIEWLASNNVKVWIIDSWSKICAWNNIDMNDNAIVMELCDEIDRIKQESGVRTVIMTAHSPKNQIEGEESAIGAQNLSGWADTIFMLVKDKDKRFLWSQGRCEEELEETEVTMDTNTGLIVLGEGSREDHRAKKRQQQADHKTLSTEMMIRQHIIEYVMANPNCSGTDIDDNVNGTATTVRKIRKQLEDDSVLIVTQGSKGRKSYSINQSALGS